MNHVGMTPAERELAERAVAGDIAARDDILTSMEPFITRQATYFRSKNPRSSVEDLVNAAWLRIIEKFGYFQPERNIRPITYFGLVARRAMVLHLKLDRVIPSPQDAKGEQCKRQEQKTRSVKSINHWRDQEGKVIEPDEVLSGREMLPEDITENRELVDRVRRCVARLPESRRRIVLMRMDGMTLREVGKVVGVTRERIRQLEVQAKEMLAVLLWREGHREQR